MLENKIGINDCQAVKKIAEFFEGFINGSIVLLNKLGFDFEKIDIVSKFDDVNNFIVKKIFLKKLDVDSIE